MKRRKKTKAQSTMFGNWLTRRIPFILTLTIALTAVLLSVSFLCRYSQDHARILRVSGTTFIERNNEKIVSSPGMVLNAQDKIITGPNSFVEVTYDDTHKDVLRVNSDSRVVLESPVIEKKTALFMDKGEIIVKLDKLERGSTFKIRTPTAVAGVRGTSFAVRLTENNKEAVITDYESRIFVKGLTTEFLEMSDELLLSDGWKVTVAQFEKPTRVEKISNEEMAAWRAWINEIDALQKGIPKDTDVLTKNQNTSSQPIWSKALTQFIFMEHIVTKKYDPTSSVSLLALLLYGALTFTIGRILLWQKGLNTTSILSNCGI